MNILRQVGVWLVRVLAVFGGLFLVLVLVGLVGLVLLNRGPQIADNSVLEIKLAGDLPEKANSDLLSGLLGSDTLTLKDLLGDLKKAAKDNRIKAVLLRIDGAALGWAQTEELRDALVALRKSGKPVTGYAELMNERLYYLALAFDRFYMPPGGIFEMNGLVNSTSHYPGLFAKLGIGVQYFRYGKYKSQSGESLGRVAFSEPVKEMINANLSEQFETFVAAVAAGRRIPVTEVRGLVDASGLSAEWALSHRLIDGVAYWDEVESQLKKQTGSDPDKNLQTVSATDYTRVAPASVGLAVGANKVGLIVAQGLIVSGNGGSPNPLSDGPTQGSEPLIKALREAGRRDEIKAVVLRVDSPGGAGIGCDLVRREVEKLRAKKPVIVSMGDSAASGGYWISMDATAIVAQPSTQTGSIGIWSVVPNLQKLYSNLALTPETFKRGAHADELIGLRPLSPSEAQGYDERLLFEYRRFVSLAAQGRHKPVADLEKIAQGRTWLGRRAQQLGLVDRLGGLDTALALAADKAKLSPDSVTFEPIDQESSPLASLLGQDALRLILRTLGIEQTVRQMAPTTGFDLLFKERLFPLASPEKFD
ncbi:signal peptide peptidase SppA [Gloeobacter kilaueensis]|uniref:Protease 4 n=1 Tax=Gloeobacter kilaueensis (strain ATCC BAA-2537 / CCAP 1431/1 / ULC 316 / JS1) TaxID=1183438 RepID=U5QL89_GLOK1|nr:signal peptide peptidase SppA [Gloeobacter kilaueensis]AGY59701.1 signal peptide peptidase SppA, 67K type [Gloeobacter kilaueensis JS1]